MAAKRTPQDADDAVYRAIIETSDKTRQEPRPGSPTARPGQRRTATPRGAAGCCARCEPPSSAAPAPATPIAAPGRGRGWKPPAPATADTRSRRPRRPTARRGEPGRPRPAARGRRPGAATPISASAIASTAAAWPGPRRPARTADGPARPDADPSRPGRRRRGAATPASPGPGHTAKARPWGWPESWLETVPGGAKRRPQLSTEPPSGPDSC